MPDRKGDRLLDARTGKQRGQLAGATVYNPVFSLDGKRIAAGLYRDSISLYDAATGRNLRPWFPTHFGRVTDLALSPDGKTLYSAGFGAICCWDLDHRRLVHRLEPAKELPRKRDFLTDGRLIASATQDGKVRIWNAAGRELDRLEGFGEVIDLQLSPDGNTLALLSVKGAVKKEAIQLPRPIHLQLWDRRARKELPRPPVQQLGTMGALLREREVALAFSPDGKLLAVNDHRQVLLWPRNARDPVRKLEGKWLVSPSALRFSPDGRLLAAACSRHCIIWDVATGKERLRLNFINNLGNGISDVMYGMAFSPDSRMLVTGHYLGIRLWELATGEERWFLKSGARGLVFTADQRLLVTGGDDGAILLWDMKRLAVPDPTAPLKSAALPALWAELAGRARPAFVAQQLLAGSPKEAVPFLTKQLRREPKAPNNATDLLRDLRALETLERIGTVAARRALSEFAKETKDARLRQQAQECLTRLPARAVGGK